LDQGAHVSSGELQKTVYKVGNSAAAICKQRIHQATRTRESRLPKMTRHRPALRQHADSSLAPRLRLYLWRQDPVRMQQERIQPHVSEKRRIISPNCRRVLCVPRTSCESATSILRTMDPDDGGKNRQRAFPSSAQTRCSRRALSLQPAKENLLWMT
jgi:hypothetical protein